MSVDKKCVLTCMLFHCVMKMFILRRNCLFYCCLPLKLSLYSSTYQLDILTYNDEDCYATYRDQDCRCVITVRKTSVSLTSQITWFQMSVINFLSRLIICDKT
jgi:hypothetical protein